MFGQSLLSGAFGSAVPCTTDTDQLFTSTTTATTIATYQFNGVTTSIPGDNYPGTASNITYAAGKFDNAAVFNGSSSYITTSNPLGTGNVSYSISAWIYLNTSHVGGIYVMYDGGSSAGTYLFFKTESSGKISIGNYGGTITSSSTLPLNQFVHVAVTRDTSNNVVLYVNGVSDATGTLSLNLSNNNPRIGALTSGAQFFNGKIDQLRVFTTALPSSAVTALYNETIATSSSASIDYQLPNPNCIAYYKMSDATDQIGNHNGTASNVDFSVAGKFGNAGAFNGSNSKITISNSSFLPQGNNSRSISCWIKTTGGSNDGVIGYGNAVNSQAFFIYINSENKLGIFAYYNNTTGNIAISNNTWNHIVATYDGTNCRLYVNGVLDFTAAKTLNTGNGEFRIGGVNWNNSSEFFPGDIDQIRIYNSAISAANVTTLYEEIEC